MDDAQDTTEIQTLDQAQAEVERMISDYVEFDGIDAADAVEAVALQCPPDIALELCRVEMGWVPRMVHQMKRDAIDAKDAERVS